MAESPAENAAVYARRCGGGLLRGRRASQVFESHGVERHECWCPTHAMPRVRPWRITLECIAVAVECLRFSRLPMNSHVVCHTEFTLLDTTGEWRTEKVHTFFSYSRRCDPRTLEHPRRYSGLCSADGHQTTNRRSWNTHEDFAQDIKRSPSIILPLVWSLILFAVAATRLVSVLIRSHWTSLWIPRKGHPAFRRKGYIVNGLLYRCAPSIQRRAALQSRSNGRRTTPLFLIIPTHLCSLSLFFG